MLSLSLIYEIIISKVYFIIADLYIRYALLNKSRYNANFKIVLFILTIQDLYEKFYNKKKLIIFILNKIFNFSIN